jgi:hypothetical protein
MTSQKLGKESDFLPGELLESDPAADRLGIAA